MLAISLILFSAVLLLLVTAAARDLRGIDDFLEVVEPGELSHEAPRVE